MSKGRCLVNRRPWGNPTSPLFFFAPWRLGASAFRAELSHPTTMQWPYFESVPNPQAPAHAKVLPAGSLPVAITLMVALIAVLIPATCVENWYGPAAARFGVYGTWWFAALAVLLAVNVVAALVVRFPGGSGGPGSC